MASVENIRSGLIDKIRTIKDKEFLKALDKLISSSASESNTVDLSVEQKALLQMSEEDIQSGRFISQEAMNKRNIEWLNEL
ncbi:MAG: hypothetical protein V7724_00775 [Sediminicola sp.]